MLIHHAVLMPSANAFEFVPDGALLIQQGLIAEIGSSADLLARYPAEERLDAGGLWLLPGFICAHARLSRILARGLALPEPDAVASGLKMAEYWQNYSRALDYEATRYSALLACLESLAQVTYPRVETVVVDNGSGDGSAAAIRLPWLATAGERTSRAT